MKCLGGKQCKCGKHRHLQLINGKYEFIHEGMSRDSIPQVDNEEKLLKQKTKQKNSVVTDSWYKNKRRK